METTSRRFYLQLLTQLSAAQQMAHCRQGENAHRGHTESLNQTFLDTALALEFPKSTFLTVRCKGGPGSVGKM